MDLDSQIEREVGMSVISVRSPGREGAIPRDEERQLPDGVPCPCPRRGVPGSLMLLLISNL